MAQYMPNYKLYFFLQFNFTIVDRLLSITVAHRPRTTTRRLSPTAGASGCGRRATVADGSSEKIKTNFIKL